MSEKRQVLPGLYYHLPPTQGKRDPFAVTGEELAALLSAQTAPKRLDGWLLDTFGGLSPLVCRELSFELLGSVDVLLGALDASARDALAAAGAAEMGLWATADIPCPYALFERVRGEVTALGGTVDEAEYGADIRLRVSLPAQTAETLRARLTELSAGGIAMTVTAEEYRPGGRVEI